MSGVHEERASLGQDNGPEVELIVSGTPLYATYQTPDGYAAVYDDDLGLFCYADLTPDGAFRSTGVSVGSPPPSGLQPNIHESDAVRATKVDVRSRQLEHRESHREGTGP